jgi:SAM-dependent methyltransferase
MALDVVDLRSFYASPLGRAANRFLSRILNERWPDCAGATVLGLGYAIPYLDGWRDKAVRVLSFMPSQQGVVAWPKDGPNASALVDPLDMPLPDACVERLLLVHALENAVDPEGLLEEAWRLLTPGGRMIVVAPNRRGFWARGDTTPFGQGRPYSRGQMRELLRQNLFSPVFSADALYLPPFRGALALQASPAVEKLGDALGLPGAGVMVVEATKEVFRPVAARPGRRFSPALQPAAALAPRASEAGAARDKCADAPLSAP